MGKTTMNKHFKPSTQACPYCGTTHGLRIASRDPRIGHAPDFICADCFTGQDDGPCFDDLEPVAAPTTPDLRAVDCKTPEQWAQWARERAEYDDPMGYGRGRY